MNNTSPYPTPSPQSNCPPGTATVRVREGKPFCEVCLNELPCECPPIRTYCLSDYPGEPRNMLSCHPKCGRTTWFRSEDVEPFFVAASKAATAEARCAELEGLWKTLEADYRCFHLSGPDMSGRDWVVRIPPTDTEPARRERHLTLRDAVAALAAAATPRAEGRGK